MPLPAPSYIQAQAVFNLARPIPRRPDIDEAFLNAVGTEFPTVANRQLLPQDAPAGAPHLIVQSTSSQLAVSSLDSNFQVRFYGEFLTDFNRCHEYLARKMEATLRGWEAVGAEPAVVGAVLGMNFSLDNEGGSDAVRHVLSTLVSAGVDPEVVHQANVALGLRVADHYFVNLSAANYELRTLNRPILPGAQTVVVAPWEGSISDAGVELTVDVNNRLASQQQGQHVVVDSAELERILEVHRNAASELGPAFLETGRVDLEAFVAGGVR